MGNLLEQTLVNKLNDDLNCAIRSVGGNTRCVNDIFDYPDIIRHQLTAKLASCFDVVAGPGIYAKTIKPSCNCDCNHGCDCNNNHCDFCNGSCDCGGGSVCHKHHDCCDCNHGCNCDCDCNKKPTLYIAANSDALITQDIELPDGSKMTTEEKTTIQDVFIKLFDEVIPGLAILESGQIITTTPEAIDASVPGKPVTGEELKPNTKYIRLNLIKRERPIYVEVQELVDESKAYTDESINNLREEVTKEVMHYRGRSSTDPLSEDGPVVILDKKAWADFKPGDVVSYGLNEYILIINREGKETWTIIGDEGKVSQEDLENVRNEVKKEAKFREDTDNAIIKLVGEKHDQLNDKIAKESEQRTAEDNSIKELISDTKSNILAEVRKEAKFREDNDNAIINLFDGKTKQLDSKLTEETKNRKEEDDILKALMEASFLDVNTKLDNLKSDLETEKTTSVHFVGVSTTNPIIEGPTIAGVQEYHIGDFVLFNKNEYLYVKQGTVIQWIMLGNDVNPEDYVMWQNVKPIDELTIKNIKY